MATAGLRVSHNALNAENDGSKLTKRVQNENAECKKNETLPAKRAALSTLATNNIRIQPFRAAKAQASHRQSEANVFGRVAHSAFEIPSQGFSIYVDKDSSKNEKETSTRSESMDIDTAVTALSRQPLTEVFLPSRVQSELNDSLMLLDSSSEKTDEDVDDQESVKDIDTGSDAILDVPEYAAEIHKYLKAAELKNRPKPTYMKKQPDINNGMRSILVDWLVEVAEEYRLSADTLYLAVNYIDRFLSSMVVLRKKLQLVGTACMLIASKLEEIYPPEVSEFVYITDDTYSGKEVRKMENLVLKVLSFDLCVPTILSFLDRYEKAADVPHDVKQKFSFLTRYLCELTLQDADPFLKYHASTIAASSVVLALHTLELPSWTPSLKHYTGFELASLHDCISDLHRAFSMAPNHTQKAIREKYSESRFLNVAKIPSPSTIPIS